MKEEKKSNTQVAISILQLLYEEHSFWNWCPRGMDGPFYNCRNRKSRETSQIVADFC